MSHTSGQVRTSTTVIDAGWPIRTRDVSYVGDACVLHGSSDFDLADLSWVRDRFPGRHVTLDGDVITVWPPLRAQPSASAPSLARRQANSSRDDQIPGLTQRKQSNDQLALRSGR
ncbi:hypothetical protein ACWDCB_44030 [Streptomyces sp. NPDC001178]